VQEIVNEINPNRDNLYIHICILHHLPPVKGLSKFKEAKKTFKKDVIAKNALDEKAFFMARTRREVSCALILYM
jgi:hypothetical protein